MLPILETERLILRPLTEEDYEACFRKKSLWETPLFSKDQKKFIFWIKKTVEKEFILYF